VPEQATLIQNAIERKIDGVAVALPDAAALGPVVQERGTPVFLSWLSTPATGTGTGTARCPSSPKAETLAGESIGRS
jgi:ABC-type sugar transport system substrate-binding protein